MSNRNHIDQRCINTIRFLAVDAVERAGVGHAGTPLGFAPAAYTLWDRFLKHNPANPLWPDRDRFVLSCGHASMMLYALLHLSGYDLSLDELKQFRRIDSLTPGHPEYKHTPGVEMTTGPLGQGFAHAVGMAIAEQHLAARLNSPEHQPVDHYTYVLASDGDMQEGVSGEAASLAGTLGLGKLICLYDDNETQIEGSTDLAFREDVGRRFEAYGWQVLGPVDGNDVEGIAACIQDAREERERPSFIIVSSRIGYGSPVEGTAAAHHGPLGEEGRAQLCARLDWPYTEPFTVSADVAAHMRKALERGAAAEQAWEERCSSLRAADPGRSELVEDALTGDLPEGWEQALDGIFEDLSTPMPPRQAGGVVLQALSSAVPFLIGGAADLGPSTKTIMRGEDDFGAASPHGRNMHFGVREHAMAAAVNGIALHGGLTPYAATYLVFADYLRPSLRLAAMMGLQVVYIFTHDSIAVGEDGPTHQAVEQVMSLRTVPGLDVIRPADPHEVAAAWRAALERKQGPTAMILARQAVPVFAPEEAARAENLERGGYVLWESDRHNVGLILIGAGAETHLVLAAAHRLDDEGVGVRVVSMPSFKRFDDQDDAYRESVLPGSVRARMSVEAGVTLGWERYVGLEGIVMGVDDFGASGPAEELFRRFSLTVDAIVANARSLIKK